MARLPSDPYYTQNVDPRPTPKVVDRWSWDDFLGGVAQGISGGANLGINLKELGIKEKERTLAELRKDPQLFLDLYDAMKGPKLTGSSVTMPSTPVTSDMIPGRDVFPDDITTLEGDTADYPGMGIPERTTPESMGVDLRAAKGARDAQLKEVADRELARQRLAQSPRAKKFLENMTETDAAAIRGEEELKVRGLKADSIKTAAEAYANADAALNRFETARERLDALIRDAVNKGDTARASSLRAQSSQLVKDGMAWQQKMEEAVKALTEHGFTEEEYNTVLEPGRKNEAIDNLIRRGAHTGRSRKPGSR